MGDSDENDSLGLEVGRWIEAGIETGEPAAEIEFLKTQQLLAHVYFVTSLLKVLNNLSLAMIINPNYFK